MRWLVTFWRWLVGLFGSGAIGLKSASYSTKIVEELLPAKLADNCLYLVEEDGCLEQAAMICPCGCGKTLHMNLLPDERPCWQVKQHNDGTATLYPSVWRKKDCGSHFWFRKGQVFWCDELSV
jgi:Family of unknown function (DUF6527)